MSEPVGKLEYSGEIDVRPFRRGTYLGGAYLEDMIERSLGPRYSYGSGWRGVAEVSIVFREAPAKKSAPRADDVP